MLRAVGNCVEITAHKLVQLKGTRMITGICDIEGQKARLPFSHPQIEPRLTLGQASLSL